MNKSEIIDIILITIVLGFCFSFRNWSGNIPFYQDYAGFVNFLTTCLVVISSIIVHEIAHKFIGSRNFADIHTKTWKWSLFLALLSTFLTNGFFIFAAVWSIIIFQKKTFSIGKRREFLGPKVRAKIAIAGPIINFIIGVIAYLIFIRTGNFLAKKFAEVNLYLAIFNMFPFFRFIYLIINIPILRPNKKGENYWEKFVHRTLAGFQNTATAKEGDIAFNEGEMVFFGSRPHWFFFFPLIIVTTICLLLTQQIFISLLIGLLIALVSWIIEHYFIEIHVKPDA